jgi:uncharacterized membrane protein YgdD (TMEM256/DUF423 family)
MVQHMNRPFLRIASFLGAAAVALGAFGAHGLARTLVDVDDANVRLDWWKTAALYHLTHALALGLAAVSAGEGGLSTASRHGFLWGIVLFSGSLYTMTLSGQKWLGAVTPFGGIALIVGWVCLGLSVARHARAPQG